MASLRAGWVIWEVLAEEGMRKCEMSVRSEGLDSSYSDT